MKLFHSILIHHHGNLCRRQQRFMIQTVKRVRLVFKKSFNSHQNVFGAMVCFFRGSFNSSLQCVASNISSFGKNIYVTIAEMIFKIFTKRSVLRRNGSISFILPNDCNHFARSDSMWKSSGASQMKTHAQTAPLRRIY